MATNGATLGGGIGGIATAANPYAAGIGAVGDAASGIISAAMPPSPPDFSTKAVNKKQDRYTTGYIAPAFTLNLTTGGNAGGLSASPAFTTDIAADTAQRAEAQGGQGNTFSALGSLLKDPAALAIVGVIIVAVFYFWKGRK